MPYDVEVHRIYEGATLTPLYMQLVQLADSGYYEATDLTCASGVYFYLYDENDEPVNITGTGATNECVITDAANGKIYYDFKSADVTDPTTERNFGYVRVYQGDEFDVFPDAEKHLEIWIQKEGNR